MLQPVFDALAGYRRYQPDEMEDRAAAPAGTPAAAGTLPPDDPG